jgi:hypothetical protein
MGAIASKTTTTEFSVFPIYLKNRPSHTCAMGAMGAMGDFFSIHRIYQRISSRETLKKFDQK